MAPRFAFVTLLTSDSYLAGALTLVNSLLDVEPFAPHDERRFDTVCLVSPETVGHTSLKALEKSFDAVVGVEQIVTESWGNLDLLGRRDLAASLTKLHTFRLTQYDKVVFLDADTLVLRPLAHLFELAHPFSAAPDQGWPDAFNSGVFVCEPSQATFDGLIGEMKRKGTWDGGDQGLLNDYFPDWHRLSFTYNVTPSAYYTYAPAYKRHGQNVNVLHFIGADKPWKRGSRGTYDPDAASKDYYGLVGQWFDVFERHFGSVQTHEVASRVRQPPESFKSTFTSLPSHVPSAPSVPAVTVSPPAPPPSKPAPVPIPPAVAAGRTSPPVMAWDPSRSSPPRDGAFQMRDPIPAGFNNLWDDPSALKRPARFQPPEQYPQPPKETHDWYKAVMQAKPDPSAVKPVFPWEEPKTPSSSRTALPPTSRKFGDSPPPAIETPQFSQPPMSFRSTSFTNAWDAIPAISKYADNLAKKHNGGHSKRSGTGSAGSATPGRKSRSTSTSSGSAGPSSSGHSRPTTTVSGGGRSKGSSSSAPMYPVKGDASSRDGDDEDDEEGDLSTTDQADDSEEERDRIAIKFRRAQAEADRTGVSPTNTRSRAFDSPSTEREMPPLSPTKTRGSGGAPLASGSKDSRFVPTSPRQSRGALLSPRIDPSSAPPPVPHVVPNRAPGTKPALHLALPARPHIPSTAGQVSPRLAGVTSPRLAAQAIRNSTAARLVSTGSGHGDAPPIVRATRVFRPETDTGVVKQQGLAALQRFVESMEADAHAAATTPTQQNPSPAGAQSHSNHYSHRGGAGSGGAFKW